MMFNVRCQGCSQSIGKGVRFNARKSKVDEYLGTPIFEFQMTCHLCSQKIAIVTDPATTSFLIKDGCTLIRPETLAEKEALIKKPTGAFEKVEARVEDHQLAKKFRPNLQKLLESRQQLKNDFELNQAMRRSHKI